MTAAAAHQARHYQLCPARLQAGVYSSSSRKGNKSLN
jgi:hypothetical protein